MKAKPVYDVLRLTQQITIDGNWNKKQWENASIADVTNFMGPIPGFRPVVKAKMMYDDKNLFVIFNVSDRFVLCVTRDINGPVWEDSCVEFFFSPDKDLQERYFNVEINCGGTPLMHYNIVPDENIRILDADDIRKIEIAHSLPQIIDPENKNEVKWTLEYRIPLLLIEKYSKVTPPKPGVEWRANFFKIAENNSNPHYITWAPVENTVPNFHLPNFFGLLKFQ